MAASGEGYAYLETRVFGLTPGDYILSFTGKTNKDNSSYLMVYKQKNRDLINNTDSFAQVVFLKDYKNFSIPITIEKPMVVETNGSVANQYSDGYEDNVSNIRILMGISNQKALNANSVALTISNVKIQKTSI